MSTLEDFNCRVTWFAVDQEVGLDDYDPLVEPFRPVNEFGLRVNDGVVRWLPREASDYTVKLGSTATAAITSAGRGREGGFARYADVSRRGGDGLRAEEGF